VTARDAAGSSADYLAALGTSGELRCFRILVSGPMPGRPEESGEFVMFLRQVGQTRLPA
jgi:hypothetical protein